MDNNAVILLRGNNCHDITTHQAQSDFGSVNYEQITQIKLACSSNSKVLLIPTHTFHSVPRTAFRRNNDDVLITQGCPAYLLDFRC